MTRSRTLLTVLCSFPEPTATTNPYITQLARALADTPELESITFTWHRALLARYDVFHAHWPENLLRGGGRAARAARQVLFLLLVVRIHLTRTAVVRTMHNQAPHEGTSATERRLLQMLDRLTVHRIALNGDPSEPDGEATTTILHGHYVDWFSRYPRCEPVPGLVVFAGLVRPYKNVPLLIAAFRAIETGPVSLRIVGRPNSLALADSIRSAAAGDDRISLDLRYVGDEQMTAEVTRGELVVLPYDEMHNSGVALMALSLGRPILVPANGANRRLSDEVGHGWVLMYAGRLTADHLRDGLARAGEIARADTPELSRRSWVDAGRRHRDVYRRAVARARAKTEGRAQRPGAAEVG